MQAMKIDDRHRRAAELRAAGHTQLEAADAVGVTPRTVRSWEKNGILAAALVHSRAEPEEPEVQAEAAAPSTNGGRPTLAAVRIRKEAALAEQHELKVKRMRGEMVPLEAVEEMIRDALAPVDVGLRTLPNELAGEWARRMGIGEREALALLGEMAETMRERLVAACEAHVAKLGGEG